MVTFWAWATDEDGVLRQGATFDSEEEARAACPPGGVVARTLRTDDGDPVVVLDGEFVSTGDLIPSIEALDAQIARLQARRAALVRLIDEVRS
jgi:hypothetical protein